MFHLYDTTLYHVLQQPHSISFHRKQIFPISAFIIFSLRTSRLFWSLSVPTMQLEEPPFTVFLFAWCIGHCHRRGPPLLPILILPRPSPPPFSPMWFIGITTRSVSIARLWCTCGGVCGRCGGVCERWIHWPSSGGSPLPFCKPWSFPVRSVAVPGQDFPSLPVYTYAPCLIIMFQPPKLDPRIRGVHRVCPTKGGVPSPDDGFFEKTLWVYLGAVYLYLLK